MAEDKDSSTVSLLLRWGGGSGAIGATATGVLAFSKQAFWTLVQAHPAVAAVVGLGWVGAGTSVGHVRRTSRRVARLQAKVGQDAAKISDLEEREQNLRTEVRELGARVTELKAHLPFYQLSAEADLHIRDELGAEAEFTKVIRFRPHTPLLQVREDLTSDGSVVVRNLSMKRITDAKQLFSVNDIGPVSAGPFPNQYCYTLREPAAPDIEYEKQLRAEFRDAFRGKDEEWQLQLNPGRTTIRIGFSVNYGKGVAKEWVRRTATRNPEAWLRHPSRNPEHIAPMAEEQTVNEITYTYQFDKPELGDIFVIKWTNPAGMQSPPAPRPLTVPPVAR